MPEFSENTENFKKHKIKKFVFQIYDENIDFIESLTPNYKNKLMNQLIYDYKIKDAKV